MFRIERTFEKKCGRPRRAPPRAAVAADFLDLRRAAAPTKIDRSAATDTLTSAQVSMLYALNFFKPKFLPALSLTDPNEQSYNRPNIIIYPYTATPQLSDFY